MKKYDNIVNALLNAQNDTPDSSQRNVYSKEQYRKLLKTVLEVLKENKDADINELRQKLYEKAGLEEKLINFFYKRKKAPGAVISFGTDKYQEKIIIGKSQEVIMDNDGNLVEVPIEMNEDTIFDLASCTKLFTSVAILQLAGNMELSLSDQIRKYLPQFNYLGNHTIFDLLTYQPYHTEKRIDSAKSVDEAENILFDAKPYSIYESYGKDRYNDIAPMILKYIVEKASGMTFEEYVKKNILNPGKMKNTFVKIPEKLIGNVANFNYDYRINSNGEVELRSFSNPGISTDLKAVALGQTEGKLSGHAGLFSNCADMVSFSQGLIDGTILHPALTKEMAKNRTSSFTVNANGIIYSPYYGFLCNSKNPNKFFCDMHQGLSGSTLSQAGWTGTQITIDPANKINLTFLSNRTHNRLSSIAEFHKYKLKKTTNKITVLNYNNQEIIDSTLYAYERREITNACLELAIQEKMLEDIIGKEKELEDVKVRKLKPTI